MGLKIYSEILNEEFSSEQIKLDFKDKLESSKPKITTKLINHNYNFQEILNNGLNKFILNELKNETEQLLIEYNVPENGGLRISLVDGYKLINSLNFLSDSIN